MGKSDLSKKLASLSTININSDDFNNPFDDDIDLIPSIVIEETVKENSKPSSKKNKPDKFKKVMDKGNNLLERYSDDIINDFDLYLENRFIEDEDSDLKNSLVGMGRRYARDTSTTAESSEIQKAFSNSEKILDKLLKEIEKDKEILQKDIDAMRMVRTKNFKTLSELIETKSQFHNTTLSVVKEMNNIKKTQFDLKYKSEKNKPEESANDLVSNQAIQQLFGMGRDNILSSVGGYEGISGAFTSEEDIVDNPGYDDETIQKIYFKDDVENDGDKFLKYENDGVEYVLILGPNETKTVIAEDRDGNIVPDYPLPSNVDELNFDISEATKTAKDDFHRSYKVRIEYDDYDDE